jgi:putative ABC transport system permease protein
MTLLRQIVIVSLLGFRTLRQRLWQSLVLVVGMACVSGVLLSMLSMAEGLHRAYLNDGDPRSAIVVSRGTLFEILSAIPREQARIVTGAPGIARAPDGSPLVDSSLVTGVPAVLRRNGARSFITLRSFGEKGQMLRPTFHLVAGRMFRPGTHELIVGAKASFQVQGVALGDKVILPDGEWPIVGVFATGDLLDGQLVGDTETLMLSIRHKTYTTVLARLASPTAFAAFRKALTTNPALSVDVMRLPEWNARISADTSAFFHMAVYGIGIILAIGALFGCFNTMYAAVESRTSEIGTLRALGYGGTAVTVSILLEAAMLSVSGGLIGASIAWLLFDGVQSGFGTDIFTLTVSPAMIGTTMLWALAVAFLGGILPSLQAAGSTVSDALRAR